jgi:hypothetical protein
VMVLPLCWHFLVDSAQHPNPKLATESSRLTELVS